MMTLAECRGDSANEPIHSLPLLPRGGSHLKQQADLFPARHRGMAAALHTIRGSSIKLETAWPEQQKMHPTKNGLPAIIQASRARLLAEEFRKFSMTAYSKQGRTQYNGFGRCPTDIVTTARRVEAAIQKQQADISPSARGA